MRKLETAKLILPAGPSGDDRAEVFEIPDGVVVVVADGAGGTAGGSEAAEQVVEAVRRAVGAPPGGRFNPDAVLLDVDQDLAAHGTGETTAVIAIVSASEVVGASVGDSGAWVARPADYLDLTKDQLRKPLLGSGSAWPVRFGHGPLDGTLLVASDGLLKHGKPKDISTAARNPDLASVPEALLRLVRLRSGELQDDVAIVVCRVVA